MDSGVFASSEPDFAFPGPLELELDLVAVWGVLPFDLLTAFDFGVSSSSFDFPDAASVDLALVFWDVDLLSFEEPFDLTDDDVAPTLLIVYLHMSKLYKK